MSETESRLLKQIESDPAFATPVLRVRAARETAAMLRRMRKYAGLTQTELAQKLSVSQARISQVESGLLDHLPPLDFVYLYAHACGVQVALTAAPPDTSVSAQEHSNPPTADVSAQIKAVVERELNAVEAMTKELKKVEALAGQLEPLRLPPKNPALESLMKVQEQLVEVQRTMESYSDVKRLRSN